MKKIIVVILFVAFIFAMGGFLTECSLMYGDEVLLSDNLHYETHYLYKICFASYYTWPSGEKNAVLDIPDTCEGYRVVGLGGFVGSGAPSPFFVNIPDAQSICLESSLPDHAQIDQYHLVINIGKYLREDTLIELDEYYHIEADRFVQILVSVNCSPENPWFYSEDGKLYRRSEGDLVEGFFYYSDYVD